MNRPARPRHALALTGFLITVLGAAAAVLVQPAHAGDTYTGWVTWSTHLQSGVTTPQNAGDVTWPQSYVGKGAIDAPCGAVHQRDYYQGVPTEKLDDWIHGGLPGSSAGGADSAWASRWTFSVGGPCETEEPTPTPTPTPTETPTPTPPPVTETPTPTPSVPASTPPSLIPPTSSSVPPIPRDSLPPADTEHRTRYVERCTYTLVISEHKAIGGAWVAAHPYEKRPHADSCHTGRSKAGTPVVVEEGF